MSFRYCQATTIHWTLLLSTSLLLASCSAEEDPPISGCVLFGVPNDNTGLDQESCQPSCACAELTWSPPAYSASDVDELAQWTLLEPPATLDVDPYLSPDQHPLQPDRVCAVVPDSSQAGAYRLGSFDDEEQAVQAGGTITHYGACGLCSSLQDLAVYLHISDLTGPVRSCALEGMSEGMERNLECLQELGFSQPCAQIWAYNSSHTRAECLAECMAALGQPYHQPDGSLNACIQCDEDNSGQVFKAVSGRTRRNSGLPSALCRPCGTVKPVIHEY